MNSIAENLVNSLSGNVPKAVLCVRNIKTLKQVTPKDTPEEMLRKKKDNMADTLEKANNLQKSLMEATAGALSGTLSSEARDSLMGQDKASL